jgi:hypothetical protein
MISFCTAAMDAKRFLILKLHKKVEKNIVIFWMLKHFNVNLRLIKRTLKRLEKIPMKSSPRKKTGRKCTARTKEAVKKVRERFRRKNDRLVRKIANTV